MRVRIEQDICRLKMEAYCNIILYLHIGSLALISITAFSSHFIHFSRLRKKLAFNYNNFTLWLHHFAFFDSGAAKLILK